MTKQEIKDFIKKISVYYPYFKIDSEEAMNEWESKLKDYDNEDVLRKLEEHLAGERADEPPKLHFITKYLKTKEEKEKMGNDYIIRCNLCGREMYLSEYDRSHYDKCLSIYTLIPILASKGEQVTYEMLEIYDKVTIDKLIYKYLPIKKEIKKII